MAELEQPELNVESVLPHAPPMILIDSVTPRSRTSTRSTVRIGEDSMFYEAPRGVPAYVGLEYIAQTVAAHAGLRTRCAGSPVRIGFLLGARRYQCAVPFFPLGSQLVIEVDAVYESPYISKFNGLIADVLRGELASCAVTVYLRTGTPGEP